MIYSLNDIIQASWEELSGKEFIRTDSNQYLGTVYAKYDNRFKLSSIINNGYVEFLRTKSGPVTYVFGVDIDPDQKLFEPIVATKEQLVAMTDEEILAIPEYVSPPYCYIGLHIDDVRERMKNWNNAKILREGEASFMETQFIHYWCQVDADDNITKITDVLM